MRNYTMIRHWKRLTLTAIGIGVLLFCGSKVSAETVTAPLNGTVSFQSGSAASDTLNVNAGSKKVKATGATKIQGSANSLISVVGNEGTGVVHVANVILRDGESLYYVTGTFTEDTEEGGEGNPNNTWSSSYNGGSQAKIILEVNADGQADDAFPVPIMAAH